jgi:NAD(P)-dependent dehydrogenase (short-subunit alcohol dehydrogenase family)
VPRAIVIGSSSGIGLAVARRLIDRGWTVTGVARREAGFAADGYAHVIGDVRSPDLAAALAGPAPELVVYCAGIGHELDVATFAGEADVVATNFLGAVSAAEALIPRMIAAGRGHFIGVSSQADRLIDRNAPSYAASKAGMSSYLEGLALACRSRGVAVTNLRLGFVDTAMSSPDGPRPFLVSADRIADVVERCMKKRPIRHTFPRRMMPLLWVFNLAARFRVWWA